MQMKMQTKICNNWYNNGYSNKLSGFESPTGHQNRKPRSQNGCAVFLVFMRVCRVSGVEHPTMCMIQRIADMIAKMQMKMQMKYHPKPAFS